jgi:hypothetical protein
MAAVLRYQSLRRGRAFPGHSSGNRHKQANFQTITLQNSFREAHFTSTDRQTVELLPNSA